MDNTENTGGAEGDSVDPEHPSEPVARRGTPRTGRIAKQAARRHRRDRIAGVLVALLGVAVLIVAFLALRNPKHTATAAGSDTHHASSRVPAASTHPSTAPSGGSTSPSSGTSSTGVTGSEPLIVLNQTTTPGLASQAAARFRSGGWQVSSTQEGYQNDVVTTTAYYDPAINGAQRAAQALARQYPTIHRVAVKFPQLPAGPVVVVLTTDYTSG